MNSKKVKRKSKTIEEIQLLKRIAENEIVNIIQNLERESGVGVDYIGIKRTPVTTTTGLKIAEKMEADIAMRI